jgi:hypothetical protein
MPILSAAYLPISERQFGMRIKCTIVLRCRENAFVFSNSTLLMPTVHALELDIHRISAAESLLVVENSDGHSSRGVFRNRERRHI